jgi:hypothetical protein
MRHPSSRDVGQGLLMVATGLVLVAAVKVKQAIHRSDLRVRMLVPAQDRAFAVDGLIGRDVSSLLDALDGASPRQGETARRETALWLVDAARCPGCLSAPAGWNDLRDNKPVDALLVVRGETQEHAERLARAAGVTGRVLGDTARRVDTVLPDILPDTRMLVSGRGIVLLADSRYAAQTCSWSVFRQIAAVKGWADGNYVRKDAPGGSATLSPPPGDKGSAPGDDPPH